MKEHQFIVRESAFSLQCWPALGTLRLDAGAIGEHFSMSPKSRDRSIQGSAGAPSPISPLMYSSALPTFRQSTDVPQRENAGTRISLTRKDSLNETCWPSPKLAGAMSPMTQQKSADDLAARIAPYATSQQQATLDHSNLVRTRQPQVLPDRLSPDGGSPVARLQPAQGSVSISPSSQQRGESDPISKGFTSPIFHHRALHPHLSVGATSPRNNQRQFPSDHSLRGLALPTHNFTSSSSTNGTPCSPIQQQSAPDHLTTFGVSPTLGQQRCLPETISIGSTPQTSFRQLFSQPYFSTGSTSPTSPQQPVSPGHHWRVPPDPLFTGDTSRQPQLNPARSPTAYAPPTLTQQSDLPNQFDVCSTSPTLNQRQLLIRNQQHYSPAMRQRAVPGNLSATTPRVPHGNNIAGWASPVSRMRHTSQELLSLGSRTRAQTQSQPLLLKPDVGSTLYTVAQPQALSALHPSGTSDFVIHPLAHPTPAITGVRVQISLLGGYPSRPISTSAPVIATMQQLTFATTPSAVVSQDTHVQDDSPGSLPTGGTTATTAQPPSSQFPADSSLNRPGGAEHLLENSKSPMMARRQTATDPIPQAPGRTDAARIWDQQSEAQRIHTADGSSPGPIRQQTTEDRRYGAILVPTTGAQRSLQTPVAQYDKSQYATGSTSQVGPSPAPTTPERHSLLAASRRTSQDSAARLSAPGTSPCATQETQLPEKAATHTAANPRFTTPDSPEDGKRSIALLKGDRNKIAQPPAGPRADGLQATAPQEIREADRGCAGVPPDSMAQQEGALRIQPTCDTTPAPTLQRDFAGSHSAGSWASSIAEPLISRARGDAVSLSQDTVGGQSQEAPGRQIAPGHIAASEISPAETLGWGSADYVATHTGGDWLSPEVSRAVSRKSHATWQGAAGQNPIPQKAAGHGAGGAPAAAHQQLQAAGRSGAELALPIWRQQEPAPRSRSTDSTAIEQPNRQSLVDRLSSDSSAPAIDEERSSQAPNVTAVLLEYTVGTAQAVAGWQIAPEEAASRATAAAAEASADCIVTRTGASQCSSDANYPRASGPHADWNLTAGENHISQTLARSDSAPQQLHTASSTDAEIATPGSNPNQQEDVSSSNGATGLQFAADCLSGVSQASKIEDGRSLQARVASSGLSQYTPGAATQAVAEQEIAAGEAAAGTTASALEASAHPVATHTGASQRSDGENFPGVSSTGDANPISQTPACAVCLPQQLEAASSTDAEVASPASNQSQDEDAPSFPAKQVLTLAAPRQQALEERLPGVSPASQNDEGRSLQARDAAGGLSQSTTGDTAPAVSERQIALGEAAAGATIAEGGVSANCLSTHTGASRLPTSGGRPGGGDPQAAWNLTGDPNPIPQTPAGSGPAQQQLQSASSADKEVSSPGSNRNQPEAAPSSHATERLTVAAPRQQALAARLPGRSSTPNNAEALSSQARLSAGDLSHYNAGASAQTVAERQIAPGDAAVGATATAGEASAYGVATHTGASRRSDGENSPGASDPRATWQLTGDPRPVSQTPARPAYLHQQPQAVRSTDAEVATFGRNQSQQEDASGSPTKKGLTGAAPREQALAERPPRVRSAANIDEGLSLQARGAGGCLSQYTFSATAQAVEERRIALADAAAGATAAAGGSSADCVSHHTGASRRSDGGNSPGAGDPQATWNLTGGQNPISQTPARPARLPQQLQAAGSADAEVPPPGSSQTQQEDATRSPDTQRLTLTAPRQQAPADRLFGVSTAPNILSLQERVAAGDLSRCADGATAQAVSERQIAPVANAACDILNPTAQMSAGENTSPRQLQSGSQGCAEAVSSPRAQQGGLPSSLTTNSLPLAATQQQGPLGSLARVSLPPNMDERWSTQSPTGRQCAVGSTLQAVSTWPGAPEYQTSAENAAPATSPQGPSPKHVANYTGSTQAPAADCGAEAGWQHTAAPGGNPPDAIAQAPPSANTGGAPPIEPLQLAAVSRICAGDAAQIGSQREDPSPSVASESSTPVPTQQLVLLDSVSAVSSACDIDEKRTLRAPAAARITSQYAEDNASRVEAGGRNSPKPVAAEGRPATETQEKHAPDPLATATGVARIPAAGRCADASELPTTWRGSAPLNPTARMSEGPEPGSLPETAAQQFEAEGTAGATQLRNRQMGPIDTQAAGGAMSAPTQHVPAADCPSICEPIIDGRQTPHAASGKAGLSHGPAGTTSRAVLGRQMSPAQIAAGEVAPPPEDVATSAGADRRAAAEFAPEASKLQTTLREEETPTLNAHLSVGPCGDDAPTTAARCVESSGAIRDGVASHISDQRESVSSYRSTRGVSHAPGRPSAASSPPPDLEQRGFRLSGATGAIPQYAAGGSQCAGSELLIALGGGAATELPPDAIRSHTSAQEQGPPNQRPLAPVCPNAGTQPAVARGQLSAEGRIDVRVGLRNRNSLQEALRAKSASCQPPRLSRQRSLSDRQSNVDLLPTIDEQESSQWPADAGGVAQHAASSAPPAVVGQRSAREQLSVGGISPAGALGRTSLGGASGGGALDTEANEQSDHSFFSADGVSAEGTSEQSAYQRNSGEQRATGDAVRTSAAGHLAAADTMPQLLGGAARAAYHQEDPPASPHIVNRTPTTGQQRCLQGPSATGGALLASLGQPVSQEQEVAASISPRSAQRTGGSPSYSGLQLQAKSGQSALVGPSPSWGEVDAVNRVVLDSAADTRPLAQAGDTAVLRQMQPLRDASATSEMLRDTVLRPPAPYQHFANAKPPATSAQRGLPGRSPVGSTGQDLRQEPADPLMFRLSSAAHDTELRPPAPEPFPVGSESRASEQKQVSPEHVFAGGSSATISREKSTAELGQMSPTSLRRQFSLGQLSIGGTPVERASDSRKWGRSSNDSHLALRRDVATLRLPTGFAYVDRGLDISPRSCYSVGCIKLPPSGTVEPSSASGMQQACKSSPSLQASPKASSPKSVDRGRGTTLDISPRMSASLAECHIHLATPTALHASPQMFDLSPQARSDGISTDSYFWMSDDGKSESLESTRVPVVFRPHVTSQYDVLGDDILDPRDTSVSWAGSANTICVRRQCFTQHRFRRISKWVVQPNLWAAKMHRLCSHYLSSVVSIRHWYQDESCFYLVYDHAGGSPLVEGLTRLPASVLPRLAKQVKSACYGLEMIGLEGVFDVILMENAGNYYVEIDPIVGFGHLGREGAFEHTRDYLLKLFQCRPQDINDASAVHRATRVRTDALVNKARSNHLIQLPDYDYFEPCNVILREEWCIALWKIYSNVAQKQEPNAKNLVCALTQHPGPWPTHWLKQQLSRGGPVPFEDIRNVFLADYDARDSFVFS